MSSKHSYKILIGLIFTITLFGVSNNIAQEEDPDQFYSIKKERTVGGHYFTLNSRIKSPFILTHVTNSLGIGGMTNFKYPLVDVGGNEFIYLQGDIFVALLDFEYQHAVKDWLAVWMHFGLVGRLGSNVGTLVKQGIDYATIFDIGWLIKIYRNDRFALSTSFQVTNGNYSFINLEQFIGDLINNIPGASLTRSNNLLYGLAGLKAAYGINDFLGFNALVNLGYGEAVERELDNKWFTILGINADMNFTNVISAPVSLALGYLHNFYSGDNDDVSILKNLFIAQISYIGRPDFILSLDLSYSKELTDAENNNIWLTTTMLTMRYLF